MEMYLCDETINRMSEAYADPSPEKALKRCLRASYHNGGGITACYLRFVEQDAWEALVSASVEQAVEIYRSMGEAGKIIIAHAVLSRGLYDSRLYKTVQDWAREIAGGDPVFHSPLHSCHLNKVALDLFVAPGKGVNAYL